MESKVLKTGDMKQYKKNYYLENKNIWSEKIACDICGKTYAASTKWRHFKTKNHKLFELQKKIMELNKIINIE